MDEKYQARQKAISTLEIAFHLKLSAEQREIVEYDYKTPMLINACAGAGKTTLLLFNIMLSILTDEFRPSGVLGITFSKRAQLDMVKKYRKAQTSLKKHGLVMNKNDRPNFSTFDALFYHLLQHFSEFRQAQVLPSYSSIKYDLYPALYYKPKNLSESGEIKAIFSFRSLLISQHYTYNGYDLIGNRDNTPTGLGKIADDFGLSRSVEFFKNYLSVAKAYDRIKKERNLVDFTDMKLLLMKKVSQHDNRTKIQKLMHNYQICFIDEFQDIDPLSWVLIQKILPKRALQRLVVIGDDDQSIYAFRGSDPKIILNYTDNYPQVKKFNLSTNYRTNGHVLNTVRPLIKHNKYRMDKDLYSSHMNVGGVYEFDGNKQESGGNLLLNKVWQMYLSPKINNKDMVILVRYNSDKMLATDWFANRGLYLKTNNLLQRNYIYRAIYGMLFSLYFDNLSTMKKWFRLIGFRKYKKHLQEAVLSANPLLPEDEKNSLYHYMKSALDYDKSRGLNKHKVGKKDKEVAKAVRQFAKGVSASEALYRVYHLTHQYFNYMVKNNFMSGILVQAIKDYLKLETQNFGSLSDFLNNENSKIDKFRALKARYHPNQVSVLTIHQAKGLQYKYVFLYNLTDRDISLRMQNENRFFSPKMGRYDFLHLLLTLTKKQMDKADSQDVRDISDNHERETPYEDLQSSFFNNLKALKKMCKHYNRASKDKKYSTQNVLAGYCKSLIKDSIHGKEFDKSDVMLQNSFNAQYEIARNDSATVEEERRLIYVGFTRAQNSAVFNAGAHSNPLLTELKVPYMHIMSSDKYGRATPVADDKKRKSIVLDRKMSEIRHKKAEIDKMLNRKVE